MRDGKLLSYLQIGALLPVLDCQVCSWTVLALVLVPYKDQKTCVLVKELTISLVRAYSVCLLAKQLHREYVMHSMLLKINIIDP